MNFLDNLGYQIALMRGQNEGWYPHPEGGTFNPEQAPADKVEEFMRAQQEAENTFLGRLFPGGPYQPKSEEERAATHAQMFGGTPPPRGTGRDTSTPQPTATPTITELLEKQDQVEQQVLGSTSNIEDRIRQGLINYGGEDLPALEYVPQFAEAAERYPLFANNPYLLPQISVLETSGGRNITRPNNLLNWGINYPGNNEIFAEKSIPWVLERAISGLGERSSYYEPFRTGEPLTREEIEQFAKTYEPKNPQYGHNLWEGMRIF